MQIYAATTNPGKLRDFAQAAFADGIEILPLPGLATLPEPVEDAPDFAGNADLKALAYSRLAPGLLVLADDSGLEVDALGGRPGVRSARFADDLQFEADTGGLGKDARKDKDARNNRCLLSLLSGIGTDRRRARFICALTLARNGEIIHRASGSVEGEILDTPRGEGGFGYDSLLLLPPLGKTMAELDPPSKWTEGHRGRAFRSLLAALR